MVRNSMTRTLGLLRFFLLRKVLRRDMPLLASLKLTYRCNLACRGCPFHRKAQEPQSHMSWETALASLHALKRLGAPIVVLEGGEPLLWRDGVYGINELVAYARGLFPIVAVTTNGTLPLDVPADVLWVSLDGLRQTHDRLRSRSFDQIWQNLLAARHPKLLVHYTLNRENWRELEEVLAMLRGVQGLGGTTVQLFYAYDQGEACLTLDHQERRAALEKALQLKKTYPLLNSRGGLLAMRDNTWTCREDILVNVDPDGTITRGCYAKRRGRIDCDACGFTPVAEASRALDMKIDALLAGCRVFL